MYISEDDSFKLNALEQSYKRSGMNQSSTFHSNNKSFERAALNFDSSFTDFAQTISKYLYKGLYIQNLSHFNPFCPLCLKFVNNNDSFTTCGIRNGQTYVIHDKCLIANSSFGMNLATEQEDDMLIIKNENFNKSCPSQNITKNLSLQFRDFLIEIIFYHPISEKRFGKLQKKIKLGKEKNYFQIKLSNVQVQDQFSPNMLVLPLTDYKMQISLQQIGQDRRTKLAKYINLKKIPGNDKKQLTFGNKEFQFNIRVCGSEQEKQKVLDQMNYKFVFPSNKISLAVIQEMWLQMPQVFKDQESEQYDQIMQSSSSKVLQFLELDGKLDEGRSFASRKTSRSNMSFESMNSKKDHSRQMKKSQQIGDIDAQKVNLDKLIKTDELKSFVKHNTQSRSFQSFLEKATNEEIDKVIEHMKSEFVQLMKHEYGNYMMQKLFSVCNLERRLQILSVLVPQLTDIVMNKQGTHAFQDFLSFFTSNEEYLLILNKIRQNFYELCVHNNATHFIQKVVKLFPMELMNEFFYYCVQNIYQFSCDKNGMCVVKYMLKKLKQLSEKTFNKSPGNQDALKLALQYKKLFVQATLFSLDAIIGDMYGNYVVQFNFELFEPTLISSLTDSILMKLPQYSLSKYSTNVVFKCLNTYWSDQKEYVSSVLKEVFQPYLILQMYKNKDGNKILLEIMERYEGYEVWNRLYNTLISTEPTRFYHDRWGACLGSRSGNVGGSWNSFSDAVQKLDSKRKNNKLF